jgi:hypothetical protein
MEAEAMRRVITAIWLGALVCFPEIGSAHPERADAYFLSEQQLPEIEALGIAPSGEPWALFEAFVKRFSVVTSGQFERSSRDIQRVIEARGGDRSTLSFLLLNLFRWNGIDAELALLSTKRNSKHDDRYIEQVLVYVPAIQQYFDPALPLDGQHNSADRTWLADRDWMHFSAALQHKGKAVGRCRDLCVYATGGKLEGEWRDPHAVRIKTIRVPTTETEKGQSK